ncbi:MAG: hypothetical protein EAZ62_05140 [Sphingobacteriia bacterium]|nr:MAG: hypothetical protein EAZ62_05140 [Sphingobacteriia bacterium]
MVPLFSVRPPLAACQTEDFRVFAARLSLLAIFLVMVLAMVLGKMPYQLTPGDRAWWGGEELTWIRAWLSVGVSSVVILAFFLPAQPWVIMAFVGLILFQLAYYGLLATDGWQAAAWWMGLAPACLHPHRVWIQWQRNRVLALVFLAFNLLTEGYNPLAFPIYFLYLLPFLPLDKLYLGFLERYEPK